jgi:hypothetical protein
VGQSRIESSPANQNWRSAFKELIMRSKVIEILFTSQGRHCIVYLSRFVRLRFFMFLREAEQAMYMHQKAMTWSE